MNKDYVAVLISENTSDSPEYETLYEETILLISAASLEEATAKAHEYGKKSEQTYVSAAGYRITTRLHKVEDVNETLGIVDGDITEVNARYFRDLDAYQKFREVLNEEELTHK